MKNKKRFLITALMIMATLSLAACGGVSAGVSIDELTGNIDGAGEDTNDHSNLNSNSSSSAQISASSDSSDNVVESSTDDDFKFYGVIEGVTENTITINGQTFTVDTAEDMSALFDVGSLYEIEYRLNEEGNLSLVEFHLEDSSMDDDSSDNYFKFKGTVDDVTERTISFGGATFEVDTSEDLTTLFEVGTFYEIKFLMNEDGSIVLLEFHPEDDDIDEDDDFPNSYFKAEGMIDDVSEKMISINGATFNVDTTEDLTTLFEVGAFYEIKFLMNEDGRIVLLEFHLEDEDMDDDNDMDDDDDNFDDMSDDDMDDDDDDDSDDDDMNDNDHDNNNDDDNNNDNDDNENNNDNDNNDNNND